MKHKFIIFIKVAQHLSFTHASKELALSQPAVSKTIAKLEEEYSTTFFIRKRNTIEITNEGKLFLGYAHKIMELHQEIDNIFLRKNDTVPNKFHFGLSTTLATYIIPKIIAKYQQNYPNSIFNIISDNTRKIEKKILNQIIDFGIVEGKSSNKLLQYSEFIKDEIVLVTRVQNNYIKNKIISKKEFIKLPMIEREIGSGTKEVIYHKLLKNNIKNLNTILLLTSTEAIKNYLYYSNTFALLSIHSITEDLITNKLKIVDIKGLDFERLFYFVSRTGFKSQKFNYFKKNIISNYNF